MISMPKDPIEPFPCGVEALRILGFGEGSKRVGIDVR